MISNLQRNNKRNKKKLKMFFTQTEDKEFQLIGSQLQKRL